MPAATQIDPDVLRSSADAACRLLKALSNPDRLLLLCHLAQGEMRVGELEAMTGVLQPTLSQQLAVLRDEGLVSTRREGKSIHYSIDSPQALAVMAVLHDNNVYPSVLSIDSNKRSSKWKSKFWGQDAANAAVRSA